MIFKKFFRKIVMRLKRIFSSYERIQFSRDTSADLFRGENSDSVRVINMINYAKTSGSSYSAKEFDSGYHEVTLKGGSVLPGQRSPSRRLKLLPIDFSGKSVLDIGCNQGGMLFNIPLPIKWGVGLDYDVRMINLCNLQKSTNKVENLDFYVFDIDTDPHGLIFDYLPEARVDVVFLLSVCMWVNKWRDIIDFCSRISTIMVFETNGSDEQQREQVDYLAGKYANVQELTSTSEDDPKQKKRMFYIASHIALNA
jgi:SAM-dependent methyltransferase